MTTVKIETRAVGQAFGCVGVVCDARTGRELATTERVYPYGNRAAAYEGAETLAAERGWTVETEVS